jgi:hypothetical protein
MKQIKFYYSIPVHLRTIPVLTDDNGNVLFIYDKVGAMTKRVPRITVASYYDPEANKMTFGAATCSPKDVFVKKIGREIAQKRALESPEITLVGINRRKLREVSKKYANELIAKHLSRYVHIDV